MTIRQNKKKKEKKALYPSHGRHRFLNFIKVQWGPYGAHNTIRRVLVVHHLVKSPPKVKGNETCLRLLLYFPAAAYAGATEKPSALTLLHFFFYFTRIHTRNPGI